ncbi:hypothetical protein [Georgenia subflava]|uniref:Uncharacterized protein n=1 Tax=Georgenia subflava TaxID=1622177 RepID=A0A6N7EQ35_9MICO|nr:hypothetical protein [Georgenia subflava]MPV39007.1 hypothetical protein [Georgenia subflava]
MLVGGIAIMLLGAVLLTRSAVELSRANAGTRWPVWSDPPRRPRRAIMLRVGGAGLAVLGSTVAGVDIGYWTVLVVLTAFTGTLVVQLNHNRGLSRASAQS